MHPFDQSSAPSQADVLAWIGQYALTHWTTRGFPLSGTHAHRAVQDHFGGVHYRRFGSERFKDFLAPGDGKHFRVLIEGTRHSIYPLGVEGPIDASREVARRSDRLKPQVWSAFTRGTQHYFDRNTDEFRAGSVADPENQVTVTPIDETTQKEWLLRFVEERDPSHLPQARELMSTPNWQWNIMGPSSFLTPSLRAAWRRVRFQKISSAVQDWCKSNNVSTDVYAAAPPHPLDTSRSQSPTSAAPPAVGHNRDLRRALLLALDAMSTEELARLPIPPCYMLPFLSKE